MCKLFQKVPVVHSVIYACELMQQSVHDPTMFPPHDHAAASTRHSPRGGGGCPSASTVRMYSRLVFFAKIILIMLKIAAEMQQLRLRGC